MFLKFGSYIFLSSFLFLCIGCSHTFLREGQSQTKRVTPLGKIKMIDESQIKWHLNITKAQKAWQLSRGNKNVVVAIIDSGVDIHHPDLKQNIWVNSKELNGKKNVDDDGNGFVDDIHGWNFVGRNGDVRDQHGHGTHVAGIVGSTGKICPPGVAPQVSLMVLKYFNPKASGKENLENTVRSINYAVQNGAHIINFSGGGPEPDEKEQTAIEQALEKNVLFVTAGGNLHSDIKKNPYYPASYMLPNMISVGASNIDDHHSNFSNRGSSILAHAPGTKVYSTLPGGKCGFLTGTSQSTPLFSGGAVLVRTYKNLKKPSDIIRYLLKTLDFKEDLKNKSQTGGRINFYRALGSEDMNVALGGTRVQYSDTNLGQVKDPLDEGGQIHQPENILFLPEIASNYQKQSQKSRSLNSKTNSLDEGNTAFKSPTDLKNLPEFLINPSTLTKFFVEEDTHTIEN